MKPVFLLTYLLYSAFSLACSCAPPGPIDDKQYAHYDFIAKGEITKVLENEGQRQFWLKVSRSYKNPQSTEEVMITTALSSAACGLNVREGDTWLIYAENHNGIFTTGLCTRSLPLKMEGMTAMPERAAEDIRFLEKRSSQVEGKKKYSIGVVDHLVSEILGEERILNIYLPKGYEENDSAVYPVIYLLDGSANEDFEHVAGLLQFCNFPWLNYMPKSIIVGIANTDRLRDFTFPSQVQEYNQKYPTNGGSGAFMDFIDSELQPHIRAHYKVSDTSMLIGQSLGGLLAAEILYKRPQMFDHYFIISPSLWYNEQSLFQDEPAFLHPDFNEQLSVYIAVGNEGKEMKKVARKLSKEIGKNRSIQREFSYFKDEDHASILHAALYEAFKNFRNDTSSTK